MNKRRVKMDKDQTWVETLLHTGLNAVNVVWDGAGEVTSKELMWR